MKNDCHSLTHSMRISVRYIHVLDEMTLAVVMVISLLLGTSPIASFSMWSTFCSYSFVSIEYDRVRLYAPQAVPVYTAFRSP